MITEELLEKYSRRYDENPSYRTLSAVMAKSELKDLAYVPYNAAKLNGGFEIELKTRGITAQQKSGRCWLFACMNILREIVAEKCDLDNFTLSGNYLAFYDKLEKANNFLEMSIQYAKEEDDSRMVSYIYEGIGDGGYWDMAVDLVKKYGVVPSEAMPETYQSEHTETLRRLTNTLLKKDAYLLREMIKEGKDVTEKKEEMLYEIYRIQCMAFGKPPVSFDFSYRDKDNFYHEDKNITPREFFDKYISSDLDEYVVIGDYPTDKMAYGNRYQFHYMGSMEEGNVVWLNLNSEELEELCLKQLKDDEPVWFGCDAGAYGDREKGVWDQDSVDYEGLLGNVELTLSKKERLVDHNSFATHAMILTGVNFDKDNKPERWKIENSWGKENGKDGYYVCSEKYFREYVYEAVINKKHLNKQQLEMLEKEAVVLKPWEVY